MKKLFLCAVLLALFITGCDSSDRQLKSKVPADAGMVCYVDVNALIKTKLFQDNKQDLLDFLKENKLTEDVFQCRSVVFISVKEEWGGVVIQSKNGQAKQLFEVYMKDKKKEDPEIQEQIVGKERIIKDDDSVCILYDDNLVLMSAMKNDPALFRTGKINPLFANINFKNMVSGAVKVEFPEKLPDQAQQALKMAPCIQKITELTVNIPCAVKDPDTEIALLFKDEQAASETLGLLNMGLGFIAQSEPDMVKLIKSKCEKNAVRITIAPAVWAKCAEMGREAQAKTKQINSMSSLKRIVIGCKLYALDNQEKYPDDLSGFIKDKNNNFSAREFIIPSDKVSKVSTNEIITPANTSYAYVGKGLTEKSAGTLPLAFEKPWLVPNQNAEYLKINVAFCDGSVKLLTMQNVKTCVDVVKQLTAKMPDSPDKQTVLRNAAAEDAARSK